MQELFHFCFWRARTYGRAQCPPDGLAFDPAPLARRDEAMRKAFSHIKAQEEALRARDGELTKLLAD